MVAVGVSAAYAVAADTGSVGQAIFGHATTGCDDTGAIAAVYRQMGRPGVTDDTAGCIIHVTTRHRCANTDVCRAVAVCNVHYLSDRCGTVICHHADDAACSAVAGGADLGCSAPGAADVCGSARASGLSNHAAHTVLGTGDGCALNAGATQGDCVAGTGAGIAYNAAYGVLSLHGGVHHMQVAQGFRGSARIANERAHVVAAADDGAVPEGQIADACVCKAAEQTCIVDIT